ncbi:right-handed parallel beta-helix repeat-containing protein [Psychroserpens sp. NJDZ02]|uniref:right-handed parallel beta-helix repeat-containing protein n=1 Tax=Psychroserpens sp. NJDZ02 TaxID=2570561 RepID=UPI0010A7B2E0|nr:right-handed parallel beta-helix repeat-containing protein [Psychroserpens sp. NJDZ02]QCE42108.1 T9SS type A sorting domain-containing protein [Psychroserpens sp. NJDZ02]
MSKKTTIFNKKLNTLIYTTLLLTSIQSFAGDTIYVDNQLSSDCVGNYSISNRNCSGSDGDAYNTFEEATAAAYPGDTVVIREGIFNSQLKPSRSGTASEPITYKNFNYEEVLITGVTLSPAILIYEVDYITIDGLKIENVRRWLNALGSNNLILKNNTFRDAVDGGGSSKTGLFFQESDHNRITHNTIDNSTQDNIGLIQSNYNLIDNNTITNAEHVLWTIKCSNYNVIRENYFYNALQKIGEVYDCANVGHGDTPYLKITSLDDTKHNVIEQNIFAFTTSPINASPYSGIQYAGQNGIIRNNIFYECQGPPISLTLYSSEATFNYGNRIYNNNFYNNEFGGINISGSTNHTFYDQEIKNNILFKNQFIQRDTRYSWYTDLDTKPVQIFTGRITDVVIDNNNIFNSQIDELYTIAYGNRDSSSNPDPKSLTWWETNHPQLFLNSLQANPNFVDASAYDFHLSQDSPMIDAGGFLTNTPSAGSGTTMVVADASYFTDGFGIAAYYGDTIQLKGQTTSAIITNVNYTTNTLTLNTPLTWTAGQELSKSYEGLAPDVGAFESGDNTLSNTDFENEKSAIKVYPNPTTSSITIELKSSESNVITNLSIVNLLGATIYNSTINNKRIVPFNMKDLPSGVYFLKINTSHKQVIKRILKN